MSELQSRWQLWVELGEWFFLAYFVVINGIYLALILVARFSLKGYMDNQALAGLPEIYSGLEPPVSILLPAFNERLTIVTAVQSLLQLSYSDFEVIVVNDGSEDETLNILIQGFDLSPFPEAYRQCLKTSPVLGIYTSSCYPNLRVIDKRHGGKADALNVGINAARFPLFCSVDADSIIQRHSLQRISYPFLADQQVVAVGGTVRVANGCRVIDGFICEVGLPRNWLALCQVVEYLRAFLFDRLGWSALGGLLIISGTFGLFKKETVIAVGGYRTDTVGEDMELVVRMHRLLRKQKQAYRVVFLPDPVSWTEAPESLRMLRNQRMRWQRGLCESLFGNLGLLFSRNGGVAGWLTFPFMLLFECLGPLIEVSGYALMLVYFCLDFISWPMFVIFNFAAISFGLLWSLSSMLLEEMSFHIYERPKQLLLLLAAAVLENFGYRQMIACWRLMGLLQWVFGGKRGWGEMIRNGAWQKP
jgi:cellulose synthase/poly-beta-1,6-N-acetylglucosamine synthase-like glycosyltransferase